LTIENANSGQFIWSSQVKEGEWFQIRYTHSVDHLPVIETYQVRQGSLVLDKVSWISFGAGLDYTGQGELVLDGTNYQYESGNWYVALAGRNYCGPYS